MIRTPVDMIIYIYQHTSVRYDVVELFHTEVRILYSFEE